MKSNIFIVIRFFMCKFVKILKNDKNMDRTSQIFCNLINELENQDKDNLSFKEIRDVLNESNIISYKPVYDKFEHLINKITGTKISNEYKDSVFYMSNDILFFEHNTISNKVFVNETSFYCYFYDENEEEYDDNMYYVRNLLSKFLQCEIETVDVFEDDDRLKIEEQLKTIK